MFINFYQKRSFIISLGLLLLSSCGENKCADVIDSDAFFELPSHLGSSYEIPSGNPMTKDGIELGRMLFYEKKLSGDNSQSCGSCHQQQYAFSDNKVFSEGIDGSKGVFNTMALSNLLWQKHFFWDGRVSSLEEQALMPIENPVEMNQTLEKAIEKLNSDERYPALFEKAFGTSIITAETIGKAIAQFERTLVSADSKYDRYLKGSYKPTDLELQGMELFQTHPIPGEVRGGNCGDCHLGVLLAGDIVGLQGFHNNGLDSDDDLKQGLMEVTGNLYDKGKFKAPSLRNIALTAPYMHDGRFATLDEVLNHYDEHIQMSETLDPLILEASNQPLFPGDPIKLYLTTDEKQAILAFLEMLTDHTFINDRRFSNPHIDNE